MFTKPWLVADKRSKSWRITQWFNVVTCESMEREKFLGKDGVTSISNSSKPFEILEEVASSSLPTFGFSSRLNTLQFTYAVLLVARNSNIPCKVRASNLRSNFHVVKRLKIHKALKHRNNKSSLQSKPAIPVLGVSSQYTHFKRHHIHRKVRSIW